MTNSLGIRDDIYPGPINLEQMFNVFPFENTLTIQYLSGREIQQMLDFVTDVSASRGCAAQAQVAGLQFVQDCGRSVHNTAPSCDDRLTGGAVPDPCAPTCTVDSDCLAPSLMARYGNVLPDGVEYFANICAGQETPNSAANTGCYCNQGLCYAHSAHNIEVNGQDLSIDGSYKGVVNNYIAAGGSGFKVLQVNTSKVQTGISMRDALISYLENNYCQCPDILAGNPTCARLPDQTGHVVIDPAAINYCQHAQVYETYLQSLTSEYQGSSLADIIAAHPEKLLAAPTGVSEGLCECGRALAAQLDPDPVCGHVTAEIKEFCQAPTQVSVVTAVEDSRIEIQTQ